MPPRLWVTTGSSSGAQAASTPSSGRTVPQRPGRCGSRPVCARAPSARATPSTPTTSTPTSSSLVAGPRGILVPKTLLHDETRLLVRRRVTGHRGEERFTVEGIERAVGGCAHRRGAGYVAEQGDLAHTIAALTMTE